MLSDNDQTFQFSDSIILRDTISELLESEGIINKVLLALNNCNTHQRQNLTEGCSKPDMIGSVCRRQSFEIEKNDYIFTEYVM